MRLLLVTMVAGITALGCKDKEAARPTEQQKAVPAGSGVVPSAAPAPQAVTSAPAMPRLDPVAAGSAFEAEAEDKAWAVTTESALKAVAPELTEVDCKQRQCRATLSAGTDTELAQMSDKLSNEDSVRGTGAKSVLLTAPVTVGGKLTMKIYVTYDR